MDFLLDGHESKRLIFQKIQQSDFRDWLQFHQDPRSSQNWKGVPQNPKTASKKDFDRTIFRYKISLGGKMALISKASEEHIDLSGLLVNEVDGMKELAIAYPLLPKYWKEGYPLEAAVPCKSYAKANNLANSLIYIVHVDKAPSQKVTLKNGMKLATDYGNPVHIYSIPL